ncbi:HWE histidine kinase domain-containing protein [Lutimaribacter marinistellae]|uniref:histidine kinase n=1 Tax=Lutimaribacter marinistellae TaxID=1820329 RepID=A0ABV7TEQ8_9RHOB
MSTPPFQSDLARLAELRIELANRMRFLNDPTELINEAAAVIGPGLGVNRASFANIDGDTFDAMPGYTDGVPQFEGSGSVSAFGAAFLLDYRQGEAIRVADVSSDPRISPEERQFLAAAQIRAFLAVALNREGAWRGVFYVHCREPRDWKAEEEDLLREAAERIWLGIDRDRAMRRLDLSETQLRLAQEVAGVGTFDWDITRDVNHWSPEIERLYNIPVGSFGGTYSDWARLVHPDDIAHAEDVVRTALEGSEDTFEAEWRARKGDGQDFWILARARIERDEAGRPIRMIGANFDISAQKEAEERLKTLTAELDHRVKNVLAVVQSIVNQSLSKAPSPFRDAVKARLQALGTSHGLLSEERWRGASLRLLIAETLRPFDQGGNVVLEGPDLLVAPKAAQGMALVFGELATNAAKYGALTLPGGSVRCEWAFEQVDGETRLDIQWTEQGGPEIETAEVGKGFGTRLITLIVEGDLKGAVHFDAEKEGMRVHFSIPSPSTASGIAEARKSSLAPGRRSKNLALAGKRILLVEDEAIVGQDLAEELRSQGAEVVGPLASCAQAIPIAARGGFDCAILDVSVDDGDTWPIAHRLLDSGTPFLFLTGYSSAKSFPMEFGNCARLEKPVNLRDLIAAATELLRQ